MMEHIISVVVLTLLLLKGLSCNIQECRLSTLGTDYRGTSVSTTVSGRTCQRWDSQEPHVHTYDRDIFFPEKSIQHAENYCRNPEPASMEGVWCFTTDPDERWENCDVPKCSATPECKLTEEGTEYRGLISKTQAAESCAFWGPSADPVLIENYCRNPDNKPEGPWCYTDVDQTQWNYCRVPFCKPSASCLTTSSGTEYVGTVSRARNGLPCQRWDAPVPHSSNYTDPAQFPDVTVSDAADFCRNPQGDKAAPWCYTMEPTVEWDYCDIPVCSCKVSDTGVEYAGTVAVTESGRQCQRWDSQTPHLHNLTDSDRFPDATLDAASNYCRNPDKDPGGPWCFTTDPAVRREPCDIQLCQDSKQLVRGKVKHVVHLGIDGLAPCFPNASAPNLLERLASQGAYTLDKGRTVMLTWSAPAWTSILSGSPAENTGVESNSWQPPWQGYPITEFSITPTTGTNLPIPNTFDVLKRQDRNVRTAFIHHWDLMQHLGSTGMPGRLDQELFCDLYDVGYYEADLCVAANTSQYLRDALPSSEYTYTFAYFTSVDDSGHTYQWCSSEYYDQVTLIDAEVGGILDTIDDLGMTDDVLVIVTTDHGGHSFSHGLQQDSDILIPMIFRGPGIKAGYTMQQSHSNIDLGPTIVDAMGFQPIYSYTGRVIEEIFDE